MKTEFEFITNLKKKSAKQPNSAVRVGIGDDCAVLPKDSKTDLVITTDLLIEDIDFRLEWTTPEFIGHKALAVSLSDVAAMGAKPFWSMLSIGVPEKVWKSDFVGKFYEGYLNLAKEYGVKLIGGDVSKTPDKIVIDSIVAGEAVKNKAILRSGAKVGDLIFVTGKLGGAAAGLKLLEEGARFEKGSKSFVQKLLLRQLKPNPQVKLGQILGGKIPATAMIDLSDGISSDLAHLCRESQVGAKIFADKIPLIRNIFPQYRKSAKLKDAKKQNSEELDFALNGGEDFELLFTINPKKKFLLEKALKKHKFSHIGEITANVEIVELIIDGETTILEPKGFRHF
jgi:thiamine-monophosphate kinase